MSCLYRDFTRQRALSLPTIFLSPCCFDKDQLTHGKHDEIVFITSSDRRCGHEKAPSGDLK
ncbi:hypothetical protein KXD40_002717 [Peronospora effusa]|nr:hypothetical protein KXD40_002717 [Peronospora effusa]